MRWVRGDGEPYMVPEQDATPMLSRLRMCRQTFVAAVRAAVPPSLDPRYAR